MKQSESSPQKSIPSKLPLSLKRWAQSIA
jgi:hypothetical protein